MIYDYFYIFNTDEFDSTGLVSKTYVVTLSGIGQKSVLVTKGNLTGITFDGVFLPLYLNSKNPFEFEGKAVYRDENKNVWVGLNGRAE